MKRLLPCVAFLIVLLPSCKNSYSKKRTFSRKVHPPFGSRIALSPVAIQEAKLPDIPIPITAKSVPFYFYSKDDHYMLAYKDNRLSIQADFYETEMDRFGCRSVLAIKGYELVS